MVETHPFPPFIPLKTKYLLLGSFTGKMTPENSYDWFYGTKRNQFWRIIEGVYGIKLDSKNAKIRLFTKLGIAVTDVIYSCERKRGSNLDNNLTNIVYNTPVISNILENNGMTRIYFSSRFVEKIFIRLFKNTLKKYHPLELITLPSPSPRYAKLSINDKIKIYKKLFPRL